MNKSLLNDYLLTHALTLPLHDIVFFIQGEHLGRGTRTNIYAGVLKLKSEDDDDMGGYSQEMKVVLKVLGSGHRDISLVRRTCGITWLARV